MDQALRLSGLTLPAEVHRASLGSRRDSLGGGLHCLQLPLISAEPGGLLALPALRVLDPQFPTETPAGRWSSCPVPSSAPGCQPDPTTRVGPAGGEQLRWARCPDDEHVSLLTDAAGSGLAVLAMSQRGTASLVEHAGLPVRSAGAHLHPLLRHPPVASRCGAGGRS